MPKRSYNNDLLNKEQDHESNQFRKNDYGQLPSVH